MALASPSLSSVLLEICFYLSAVFVHSAASLNATCYYPDGSVASSDTPCSSTGSSASCCEDKLYCLSNGLCLDIAHVFYVRGSCTDPTWPASSCPRRCLGGGLGGGPGRSETIAKCDDDYSYSCDLKTCATQNFSIPEFGSIQLVLRDYQLSSLSLALSTPIATSTDSAISSASTDLPTTPTASTTLSTTPTETKDITPTAMPPIASNNHNTLTVGLGAGIPIGLVALAGLLTVLILARRKINTLTNGIEKSQADLLAYKEGQTRYEQRSPRIYEAPFVYPEMSTGGRNEHELDSEVR